MRTRAGRCPSKSRSAPSHEAQLQSLLASVYNAKSANYEHWLKAGQFDARFAPSSSERAAVAEYLKASGLRVVSSSSPFLVRATGSSHVVSTTFKTTLALYRDPKGITYFQNSSAVRMPAKLIPGVLGVIGLTNTVRERSMVARVNNVIRPLGKQSTPSVPACEAPYPTTAQLFAAVSYGTPFAFGYGASPGCNGLTPSQTNSLYDAPKPWREREGRRCQRRSFRAFRLPALRHRHVGAHLLRPGLQPAARRRQCRRRAARPDLPRGGHLPAELQRLRG